MADATPLFRYLHFISYFLTFVAIRQAHGTTLLLYLLHVLKLHKSNSCKLVFTSKSVSNAKYWSQINSGYMVLFVAKFQAVTPPEIDMKPRLDVKFVSYKKLITDSAAGIGTVKIFSDSGAFLFNLERVKFQIGVCFQISPEIISQKYARRGFIISLIVCR